MEFSFTDLGDVSAYIGVPLTILASYWLVLPHLRGTNKAYYIYLLFWGVPYIIGNICDSNKIGAIWVRWHLVDVSYEAWSMALGVVIYTLAMKLTHRPYDQRSIMMYAGISLAVFMAMAYAWEIGQTLLALRGFGSAGDLTDYGYYAIGAGLAALPFIAFSRLRAAAYAQLS